MRVRARVNQADINELRVGQRGHVGLDAYPDLSFTGRVDQISPLGVQSTLSPKVRNFIVLVEVDGVAPEPDARPDRVARRRARARSRGALVVPRDAVRFDGEQAFVRVQRGGDVRASRTVTRRADERARGGRHLRPRRKARSSRATRRHARSAAMKPCPAAWRPAPGPPKSAVAVLLLVALA